MVVKKILQINTDRIRAAHDLLSETVSRLNIDLAIIAEPNRKIAETKGWERDNRGDAAVVAYNNNIAVDGIIKGNGFIGWRMGGLTVFSCYISPNCQLTDYKRDIDELWETLTQQHGQILVAGDFNAASQTWGSKKSDPRGKYLLEMVTDLDMVILNKGITPTFERGPRSSRPDITIASQELAGRIANWKVLDEESMSGHKYITYDIVENKPEVCPENGKWSLKKLNTEKFAEIIKKEQIETPEDLINATTKACNGSMPKKKTRRRQEVYWWNNEIAEARRKCIECRRRYTRSNTKKKKNNRQQDVQSDTCRQEYRTAKFTLQTLINEAKEKRWEGICEEVDQDVWGLGYKIVTKKLKGNPPIQISMNKIQEVVAVLFPEHEKFDRAVVPVQSVPEVTADELHKVRDQIKVKKAPGPDHLPPEIIKLASDIIPEKIRKVMTDVILSGTFPVMWKTAKLVLLRKPNKKAEDPTGYRPLCLLDCYGKLLEGILLNRIELLLQNHCALADNQYGFRKGRSTLDAIKKVTAAAEAAKSGTHRNRKLCVLIALDVRNAFNSAPWQAILDELKRRDFPRYMYNIIGSYLHQRRIVARDVEGRTKTFEVSSGVPQGSILGPTLWNILYDGVLRLDLGTDVQLVGFADDLALIVSAQKEQVLMAKANTALYRIGSWMKQKRLRLAPEKTESVMLSGKKRHGPITFLVEGVEVKPGEKLKYLGIWFDQSLKFNKHIEEVSGKAERLTTALGQLMPRRGGPRASKRRLLASVAHSIMLYGAPIWEKILKMAKYKHMLSRIQRLLGIRICGAYRTISLEAVQVIAGLIPIERLAVERARRYYKEDQKTHEEERQRTLTEWEAEWRKNGKGAWTRELIPNLKEWMERKHGEIDRWTTQALSGHGVFNTYLNTIGKAISDECPYCGETDTPQHAIFECHIFEYERNEVTGTENKLSPGNLISRMLKNEEEWEKCTKLIKLIMKTREDDEWDKQKTTS